MKGSISSLSIPILLLLLPGFGQVWGQAAKQPGSRESTTTTLRPVINHVVWAKNSQNVTDNGFCTPLETVPESARPNLFQLTNDTADDSVPVPSDQLDLLGSNGEEVKDYILRKHNCLRSKAAASNMLMLQWNDTVAAQAQSWADTCIYAHNEAANRTTSQFPCGQNIGYAVRDAISWNRMINLWYNEVKDYNFNGSNINLVIGHYTQIVWAKTWQLGCAYKNCRGFHYYVCNYGPRGNLQLPSGKMEVPYLPGSRCSSCPKSCSNGYFCDEGCPAINTNSACEALAAAKKTFCSTSLARSCRATCQCKGTEKIY